MSNPESSTVFAARVQEFLRDLPVTLEEVQAAQRAAAVIARLNDEREDEARALALTLLSQGSVTARACLRRLLRRSVFASVSRSESPMDRQLWRAAEAACADIGSAPRKLLPRWEGLLFAAPRREEKEGPLVYSFAGAWFLPCDALIERMAAVLGPWDPVPTDALANLKTLVWIEAVGWGECRNAGEAPMAVAWLSSGTERLLCSRGAPAALPLQAVHGLLPEKNASAVRTVLPGWQVRSQPLSLAAHQWLEAGLKRWQRHVAVMPARRHRDVLSSGDVAFLFFSLDFCSPPSPLVLAELRAARVIGTQGEESFFPRLALDGCGREEGFLVILQAEGETYRGDQTEALAHAAAQLRASFAARNPWQPRSEERSWQSFVEGWQ